MGREDEARARGRIDFVKEAILCLENRVML